MKYLLGFLLVIIWGGVFGQFSYIYSYGGLQNETGSDIVQTSDDGFFALGSTGSSDNDNSQAYLIKVDLDLNFEWSKVFGNDQVETGKSIVSSGDGNYIILTNVIIENDYNIKIYKINEDGDILWSFTYGEEDWDFGNDLISVSDGYIICGETYNNSLGQNDAYIFKIDLDGNLLWEHNYGGIENDVFNALVKDTDENILFVGTSNSFNTEVYDQIYYGKLDPLGALLWGNAIGDTISQGTGIDLNTESIMIVGATESIDNGYQATYLLLDINDGTIDNYNLSGGAADDYYIQVKFLDSEFYIAGQTNSFGGGGSDGWFHNRNSNGSYIQGTTFGQSNNDRLINLIATNQNQIVSVGNFGSYLNNSNDLMITKVTGLDDFAPEETKIYGSFLDETVSIYEASTEFFSIFPNPTINNLHINSNIEFNSVSIINSIGSVVYYKNNLSSNKFKITDLSLLNSGLYFLKIKNSNHTEYSQKIIIE